MIMAKDSHGNYVKIEDIKQQDGFKGISPIDFKSNGDNLKNYRVYGNTVNGESVGDRTGNLFDCDNMENTKVNGIVWNCKNQIITANGATGNLSSSTFGHKHITGLHGSFILACVSDTINACICVVSVQETPSSIRTYYISTTNSYATFSLTGEEYDVIAYAQVNKNEEVNNAQFFISLTEGSTPPDTYEPYGYRVPVKVEGKNLLQNTATSQWVRGITFTINGDGSVTCNGTLTSNNEYADLIISGVFLGDTDILENGNYTVSCNGSENALMIVGNSEGELGRTRTTEVNISGNLTWAILRIRKADPEITVYPMIRKASIEDDTYEPYQLPITTNLYLPEQIRKVGDEAEYIDYSEQKMHRVRKNLLKNTATSQTINGVTFTVNSDGSVTCNGTANNTILYEIHRFPRFSGKCILSGCPINGGKNTYRLQYTNMSNIAYQEYGTGVDIYQFDETQYPTSRINIRIENGYTCNNLTFYPMIRKADIEDDTYEPYIENSEVDVTIPALPTLSSTNTLSVNTNIKPSKVWGGLNDPRDILYVKDKLGNILFSKYYEIEDEPPLTFKAKKAGALKDYRIYGNTVDGESVGDRTGNLFEGEWTQGGIYNTGEIDNENQLRIKAIIPVIPSQTYTIRTNLLIRMIYAYNNTTLSSGIISNLLDARDGVESAVITIPTNANLIAVSLKKSDNSNVTPSNVEWTMLNFGSQPLPYEPYGYRVPVKVEGKNLFNNIWEQGNIRADNGQKEASNIMICSDYFPVEYDKTYSISRTISEGYNNVRGYDASKNYIGGGTTVCSVNNPFVNAGTKKGIFKITNSLVAFVKFNHYSNNLNMKYMIVEGDYTNTPIPPYEPYREPVITTLYLPEQIKKVGDEAEYIDFMEQKQHFADGTSADITLPTLPTLSGTNTLSVETEVQPSDIYLKGKIEKKPKIYYYSQDGQTLLYTESVLKGGNGTYSTTPTKPSTAQYTYTFVGWAAQPNQTAATANILTNVQTNINVYAAFSETVRTYTVYFYNGQTLLQTVNNVLYNGTATYTGATPTISQTGYIFSGWSPSNTNITADTSCYAQFVDEDMYESISDTWSEIITNVSNGTYSTKYHIGDTKKIDLNTEGEVIMTIVGIDTDDLADNSGKAPITWISKQLLKTSHRMNPMEQDGTSGTGTLGGWEKTEMRSYLKETVKPLIPETVRNAIKPVKKYSRIYNVSGSAVNDVLTTEDVWIPSYKELFGSGLETLGPTYLTAFPDDASRIKRKAGDSAAWWWWLRSANYTYTFNYVRANGSYSNTYINETGGVALGFCLGAPTYTVTYYSQNGQTVLSTETVEEGHDCTYSTVPTKESDTDFDHIFTGWSTSTNSTTATAGATENIQQNTNLYAAFSKSFKTDTISDSWEEIIANCDNGTYASKYQIGDLKTIDVGTEGPVQMQIVAIDTDLLASDNTKKAPITWISKQLLNTYKTMHSTASGYLSNWANCDMRTYLRGTILPMLPSIVQNNIKEVTKYTNQRTGSTTFTTISSTEDIWLPSYREISNNTSYCETSGVQYSSIFTNDASRVKSKVGNNAYYWWTRSASGDSDSYYSYCFAYVYSSGSASYSGRYCTGSGGVAIGFCT